MARILGVTPSSLHRWRRLARQPDGLLAKPARGPKPLLSDQQLTVLEALLEQGAGAHGWCNQLWTGKRVAALIYRHFGVGYHPAHVLKLLHRRLDWTSQKPQKHARECNDKEVERWIADDWPRIIRQAFQRRACIALLDESGFMLSPTVRRTLAPRGKTPILVCSDKHDRISVVSAITLSPRALRVGLHFMLLDDENFHGEEVVLFLRQLKGEVGGPWTIVWDRNNIHSKSRVVKGWLADHPEVVVEDFPSHAPDTNPDEEVWSWTKYGKLCNLAPADVSDLRQHVWGALCELRGQPQLLVSFILHARVPLLL